HRIPTGFATLDAALRGGLAVGELAIVGGAPDAGKTAIVATIAHRALRRGDPVAGKCVDEGPLDLFGRLAVREGISLEAYERRDVGTIAALESATRDLPLLLYSSSTSLESSIED